MAQPATKLIFIGVTTGGSSIMQIFPKWARILGLNAEIHGIDAPLNAPAALYRRIVEDIRDDAGTRGALVTTHKIDLLDACRDLFHGLDPYADICAEVACIAKRDGRLLGFAKDVISSGLALDHFVRAGHWHSGQRDVLCLGAGGAATAISVCLAERSRDAAGPRRFILVDVLPGRLEVIREKLRKLDTRIEFEYYLTGSASENDRLLEDLPGGSLVINATGMGKDLPGSPLTAAARFPHCGLVWELNYRGERQFLQQARSQADERQLNIEDGWAYFVQGWTQAIAEVFQVKLSDRVLRQLEAAAATLRS